MVELSAPQAALEQEAAKEREEDRQQQTLGCSSATILSADQCFLLERNRQQNRQKQSNFNPLNEGDNLIVLSSHSSDIVTQQAIKQHQDLGYQLRAFSENINAIETDPWTQTSDITQNIHVPSLSTELVNETLNYFVNCRQRLSQMTKTYDDNDAYILLLQEKEVDLELAARIGQELLQQNKQLKESIRQLESELTKRQDDIQQLRHELAKKASLLDTYIEEEEHQDDEDYNVSLGNLRQAVKSKSDTSATKLDESITIQIVESNKRLCELQDEILFKGEQSLLQQERIFRLEGQLRDSDRRLDDVVCENESLRKSILQSADTQQELYDELKVCKRNFSELLGVFLELQRECRINRSMHHNSNLTHILGELDPVDDGNNISFDSFTESLLPPPFDLHNTNNCGRTSAMNDFNQSSGIFTHQQCQMSGCGTSSSFDQQASQQQHPNHLNPYQQQPNYQHYNHFREPTSLDSHRSAPDRYNSAGMVMSSSLHEELLESLQKTDDLEEGQEEAANCHEDQEGNEADDNDQLNKHHDSDGGTCSDGTDSGLHTHTNISTSVTPSSNNNTDTDDGCEEALFIRSTGRRAGHSGATGGNGRSNGRGCRSGASMNSGKSSQDRDDQDDSCDRKHWLGFSSFVFSTLLLLCISATFTSSGNSNLAQRLQIKLDR